LETPPCKETPHEDQPSKKRNAGEEAKFALLFPRCHDLAGVERAGLPFAPRPPTSQQATQDEHTRKADNERPGDWIAIGEALEELNERLCASPLSQQSWIRGKKAHESLLMES
jgi:hypothetical protein